MKEIETIVDDVGIDVNDYPFFDYHLEKLDGYNDRGLRRKQRREICHLFVKPLGLRKRDCVVLDVGCGVGIEVAIMRSLGVDAWGIDNDPWAVSFLPLAEAEPYCMIGDLTNRDGLVLSVTGNVGIDGCLNDKGEITLLKPTHIVSSNVLEYLCEREISRFLADGAELGVTEMAHILHASDQLMFSGYGAPFVTNKNFDGWMDLLEQSGWRVREDSRREDRYNIYYLTRV